MLGSFRFVKGFVPNLLPGVVLLLLSSSFVQTKKKKKKRAKRKGLPNMERGAQATLGWRKGRVGGQQVPSAFESLKCTFQSQGPPSPLCPRAREEKPSRAEWTTSTTNGRNRFSIKGKGQQKSPNLLWLGGSNSGGRDGKSTHTGIAAKTFFLVGHFHSGLTLAALFLDREEDVVDEEAPPPPPRRPWKRDLMLCRGGDGSRRLIHTAFVAQIILGRGNSPRGVI